MNSRHVDTLVHDGEVVTSSDVVRTSVAIKDGRIVALGPRELLPEAERYIDASGKYVLPGAIDAHMHIDSLKCDGWVDAPMAAAHSGITSLIVFCIYDDLNGETIPTAIRRIKEEAKAASVLDYAFHFILHKQPYILEGLPEAFDMGVTSYKMFMTYKTRKYRMCSDDFICQAMDVIGSNGGLTQLHCENGDVLDYLQNKLMSEGCTHPRYFPQACPPWAEAEAVNRAIQMGAMTNCPTYVVHLSTQGGLEKIKDAQRNGQRVWTETCPQYLLLSDAEMEKWGPHAKIGPPLRPEEGPDQDALWAGSARRTHLHSGERPLGDAQGKEGVGVGQRVPGRAGEYGALWERVGGDDAAADVQRGRGEEGDVDNVDSEGVGGEPGACVRAVSPEGDDQHRVGRRPFAHRPGLRADHHGVGLEDQCRTDPLRGVGAEGATLDDDGERRGGDEGGGDSAEAGLRRIRGLRRSESALGRAGGLWGAGGLGAVGAEAGAAFGRPTVGDHFAGEEVGEDAVGGVFV